MTSILYFAAEYGAKVNLGRGQVTPLPQH